MDLILNEYDVNFKFIEEHPADAAMHIVEKVCDNHFRPFALCNNIVLLSVDNKKFRFIKRRHHYFDSTLFKGELFSHKLLEPCSADPLYYIKGRETLPFPDVVYKEN